MVGKSRGRHGRCALAVVIVSLTGCEHLGRLREPSPSILGAGRTEDMPELETYLKPEDIAFAIRTVLEQPRRLRTQYWTMWSMAQGS